MSGIDVSGDLHFWRIDAVLERIGLSKSQFYRRQKDTDPALNPTPKPHHYQGDTRNGSFYLSTDVRAWQLRELGIDPTPAAPGDVAKLLG